MTISRIIEVLEARLLTKGADCTREVHTACGSDMMSDVLAYVKDQAVLLTGLNNPQVVRTADMMGYDLHCICARQMPGRYASGPGGGTGHRRDGHRQNDVHRVRPCFTARACGEVWADMAESICLHYTVPGDDFTRAARPAPI